MFYLYLALLIAGVLLALSSFILLLRVWVGRLIGGFWVCVLHMVYVIAGVLGAVWAFSQMSSVS